MAGAPLVLVGDDLAEALARAAPARRDAVFVVLNAPVPEQVFEVALALGAESVAELAKSEGWLVERLTDVVDSGPARGLTIGVVGGSGGSGATTFACALGQVAARSGPAVVIDLDPLGPGTDQVLGLDHLDGVRWEALGHTTGRLSARALRESLPRRDGVAALSWYPGTQPRALPAFAAREALSAARRGHDTVVVDLPRAPDPLVDEIAARCDHVLLVRPGHGRRRLRRDAGPAVASGCPPTSGSSCGARRWTTTPSAGSWARRSSRGCPTSGVSRSRSTSGSVRCGRDGGRWAEPRRVSWRRSRVGRAA